MKNKQIAKVSKKDSMPPLHPRQKLAIVSFLAFLILSTVLYQVFYATNNHISFCSWLQIPNYNQSCQFVHSGISNPCLFLRNFVLFGISILWGVFFYIIALPSKERLYNKVLRQMLTFEIKNIITQISGKDKYVDFARKILFNDNIKSRDEFDDLISFCRENLGADNQIKENTLSITKTKWLAKLTSYSKIINLTILLIAQTKELGDEGFYNWLNELYRNLRNAVKKNGVLKLTGLIPFCLFFFGMIAGSWFSTLFIDHNWEYIWHQTWLTPLTYLWTGIVFALISFVAIDVYGRWFAEQTKTTLDDVFMAIIATPISVSSIFFGLYFFVLKIPQSDHDSLQALAHFFSCNNFVKATSIFLAGWVVIFIFNRIIVSSLERWAEHTDQRYDDMFVKLLQLFGSFILIAVFLGLELAAFQGEIAKLTDGENILLPYAIIVSTFGALLGYATREGIENFFGGILLQIEKPFEKGQRLLYENHYCDVQEVGMRSTLLYDIKESIQISVPNRKIASETILNLSRPDVSLRITSSVKIPFSDANGQLWSEGILLNLAYQNEEVDQTRIVKENVSPDLRSLGRESLIELLAHLIAQYPNVSEIKHTTFVGNRATIKPCWNEVQAYQESIKDLRLKYQTIEDGIYKKSPIFNSPIFRKIVFIKASNPDISTAKVQQFVQERYGKLNESLSEEKILLFTDEYKKQISIVEQIQAHVEKIESAVMVIAESIGYQPIVKSVLDEIRKEPRIFAKPSADLSEINLELRYFSVYMGRSDAVQYQMEKDIRRAFSLMRIAGKVSDK